MVNCEILTNAGIDIDDLIKRLMGNESLVKVFVKKFIEDKTFEQLHNAFAQKDIQQAESASHTLKGICGNLSLTGLYELFTEQVSLIRAGEHSKAEAMMNAIEIDFGKAVSGMQKWLENAC